MRLWDNAAALRRLYRWLYVCVMLCLLAAAGIWMVHSPYFPIKQVRIEQTLHRVDAKQIKAISDQYLRGNIFTVDVNRAQAALSTLPWVKQAKVTRIWPDTIVVSLQEQIPVARWQDGYLVNADGELFTADSEETWPVFEVNALSEHPAIAKQMVDNLVAFDTLLRPLGLQIEALNLSDRSAWTLVLNNHIRVYLGREQVNERLQRFVWVWPRLLQADAADIAYVDMRYKDGFALRKHDKPDTANTVPVE